MTTKWKFTPIPPGWVDRFPDGDYTVGRGADPRSKAEREADAKRAAGKGADKTSKKPARPAAE